VSERDVELVRRAIAAAIAQPPDLTSLNALVASEAVFTSDWGVEGRTYDGPAGVAEAIAELDTLWQEWAQEIEQVIDAGERGVVVFLRLKARGRDSGAPVEQAWAMVSRVRDGLIVESTAFTDRARALAFAGLPA
jgi:ketosteroid isomerase-like protein